MRQPYIVLSGGGSGGPVAPLLAVAEEMRMTKTDLNMHWVGTRKGPEKAMVETVGMTYTAISWAKLRRYFDIRNIFIPIWISLAFWESFFFLVGMKPKAVVSAGGFVSVPLVWAAWVLRIPTLIHQQDVRPGLANKLMAPFASVITAVFKETKKTFPNAKIIGNPVRDMTPKTKTFKFHKKKPVVLITGGGTGAAGINTLVTEDLLEFAQVVHLTGGRKAPVIEHKDYHQRDFLAEEFKEVMAAADLVVSRAGMGTITEMALLSKPAIIIPIPNSHQEDNAAVLKKADAALVVEQGELSSADFSNIIKTSLSSGDMKKRAKRLHELLGKDGDAAMVKILTELID